MRLAYSAVIERSADDPAEATVYFPDFGHDYDGLIAWGDKATMLKAAAFTLGAAYAGVTCFGDKAPEPVKRRAAASKTRIIDTVTCDYDKFCEHCLQIREIDLS